MNTDQNIKKWDKKKLAEEARKLFGLELPETMDRDEMLKAFVNARDARNANNDHTDRNTSPEKGKNSRIKVIFHNQDGPGGSDDIFVSVNGRAYLIKREHEVRLPREVMRVIENAEQSVFERGADNRMREKLVKRYSYTVLGDAA
jgi:hypothetical protein